MQLKQIARDALLKPLQAVSGIVERRHTLPILANVLLEQRDGSLYVTATDLEMQITARSAMEGKDGQATTVGARKLQDLLRALPDDSDAQHRRRQQQDDRASRALALQPADARGRRLPAHRRGDRAAANAVAAAEGPPRAVQARRVRDGAAGHPLLPERHAARARQGARCRPWPPTAIGCRGRASASPATLRCAARK